MDIGFGETEHLQCGRSFVCGGVPVAPEQLVRGYGLSLEYLVLEFEHQALGRLESDALDALDPVDVFVQDAVAQEHID